MIEFLISQTSSYTKDFCHSVNVGKIHSVYHKTINILADSQILALQTKKSPLSPISLITKLNTDDFNALGISVGDEVLFEKEKIIVNAQSDTYLFSYCDAETIDLDLTKTDLKDTSRLSSSIQTVLNYCQCGGFSELFKDQEDISTSNHFLILNATKTRLSECSEFLQNKDFQGAADCFTRLIGLGIGLTPSGDDFLCGILAGLILAKKDTCQFADILKHNININLKNTNEISAAFLDCAAKGQFSLAVNSLKENPSPAQIYDSFREIGHSSGMDTLCGVLFALKHFSSSVYSAPRNL